MGVHKILCSEDDLASKLEQTLWGHELSLEHVSLVSQYLDFCTARQGTVIFEEGHNDTSMAIVTRGRVDIVKQQSSSRINLIASIYHSEAFGEMSLIDDEPRSARAIAATDVELLLLTRQQLLNLRNAHPKLAFDLLWLITRQISQRLRQTNGNLIAELNRAS